MSVLLLIIALVLFVLAGFGVTLHPRVQLVAWGLFFGFLWLGVGGEGLSKLFG
jgi:hypothetical protein